MEWYGQVVRTLASLQYGLGSIPVQCHTCSMWTAEFVVGSRLAPGVFLRVLRLSSLQQNQHSKFQYEKYRELTWKPAKADVASSLNIVNYLS